MDFKTKNVIYIVIAIVLIIVLGISFNLIIKKFLTIPCDKTTDKRYSQFNNMCGPKKCPDGSTVQPIKDKNGKIINLECCNGKICNNPKSPHFQKCLPNDFCTPTDGLNFNYNSDNCDCDVSCIDKNLSANPPSVDMDFIQNKWTPQITPTCEIKCSYSKAGNNPDGSEVNGYCLENHICGQHFLKGSEKPDKAGCFDSTKYKKCESTKVKDLVCATTEQCNNDGYCETDYCGKDNKDVVYACSEANDCVDEAGTSYSCNKNDPILTSKKINNVGYCQIKDSNGNPISYPKTEKCLPKTNIGESNKNTLILCPGEQIGINADINCSTTTTGCVGAKTSFCDNKWQPIPESGAKNCSTESNPNLWCCKNVVTLENGKKVCCPVSDSDCIQRTTYPYSANFLEKDKKYLDTIACTTDSDCNKYNDEFVKSLSTKNVKVQYSDKSLANYASLYCDTNEKKCKASCGFDGTINKGDTYKLGVTNDDNSKISFCFPENNLKLSEQSWSNGTAKTNDSGVNIPICQSSTPDVDNNLYWTSKGDGQTQNYNTSFTQNITNNDPNNITISDSNGALLCASAAKNYNGVNQVSYTTDSRNNHICKFSVDCNNYKINDNVPWINMKNNAKNDPNTYSFLNEQIIGNQPYNVPSDKSTNLCDQEKKMWDSEFLAPIAIEHPTESRCIFVNRTNENVWNNHNLLEDGTYCKNGVKMSPDAPGKDAFYGCNI